MDDLLAARSQMALSLAFHIIFAVPVLVALAVGAIVLVPSFWYLYQVFRFQHGDEKES